MESFDRVRFAKNNWSKRGDNREQSRFSLLTKNHCRRAHDVDLNPSRSRSLFPASVSRPREGYARSHRDAHVRQSRVQRWRWRRWRFITYNGNRVSFSSSLSTPSSFRSFHGPADGYLWPSRTLSAIRGWSIAWEADNVVSGCLIIHVP